MLKEEEIVKEDNLPQVVHELLEENKNVMAPKMPKQLPPKEGS